MLNLDLWKLLLLDLKSIASDILRYIFEPAEWIRYIAIFFNLPSEYDTWPADKPPIYLQKSFISTVRVHFHISQLTSKLAFQNIMNYLRLLLFFFVLLASLQLTSADCWDRCERYLSHDAVDGKWDYCMNVC